MKLTPLEPWIVGKIDGNGGRLERAELERYQLQRLRETLRLARAASSFYRRQLAQAPADLGSLRDLALLPFTSAQDLHDYPLQMLCVSQDAIQRIVTLDSSGTTGKPKRVYFTQEDQELTVDFFQVGMATFTAAGDRVLILLPGARPGSVGDLLANALQRLGAVGLKHGPLCNVPTTLDLIAAESVTVIVGSPTQVLALARHPGADRLRLKSVLLTTDHVPHAIVGAVEQAWGAEVYNHYGMTEMGLGGGVECRVRRGYHLREADLLFEIVDPLSGQPLADGEYGEIVFTTLTRNGMPLIRYRSGDRGRFIPGGCACGTALKRLERVRERLSGMIRLTKPGTLHASPEPADAAGACAANTYLSMADLDEALFPIAGLVTFSATISSFQQEDAGAQSVQLAASNDRTLLSITACVSADYLEHIAPQISAALESLPAIRCMLQTGRLDLAITIAIADPACPPPLVKRTIVDRR